MTVAVLAIWHFIVQLHRRVTRKGWQWQVDINGTSLFSTFNSLTTLKLDCATLESKLIG